MAMDSHLSKSRISVAVLLLTVLLYLPAIAESLPPSWPWQGVTMNQNSTNPQNIHTLVKNLNVNSVRLTLRPRSKAKIGNLSPEKAWQATLDWADAMLDTCKQNNLTCIISLSQLPIDPALGIKQSSPKFWENQKLMDQVVDLAAALAKRFHGRGTELGAYQILNEPLVRDGRAKRPVNWPNLILRIIDEIRKYDPDRYVCVAAGPGGSPRGIKTFQPIPRKRLIYTAHMYIPHSFTHQGIHGRKMGATYPSKLGQKKLNKNEIYQALKHLRSFEKANDALVYISEFSAARWAKGAERYLLDVADVMTSYGWSFSYHSWGGYYAWSPFYADGYSGDKPEVLQRQFRNNTPRFETLRTIFNPQLRSEDFDTMKPAAGFKPLNEPLFEGASYQSVRSQ